MASDESEAVTEPLRNRLRSQTRKKKQKKSDKASSEEGSAGVPTVDSDEKKMPTLAAGSGETSEESSNGPTHSAEGEQHKDSDEDAVFVKELKKTNGENKKEKGKKNDADNLDSPNQGQKRKRDSHDRSDAKQAEKPAVANVMLPPRKRKILGRLWPPPVPGVNVLAKSNVPVRTNGDKKKRRKAGIQKQRQTDKPRTTRGREVKEAGKSRAEQEISQGLPKVISKKRNGSSRANPMQSRSVVVAAGKKENAFKKQWDLRKEKVQKKRAFDEKKGVDPQQKKAIISKTKPTDAMKKKNELALCDNQAIPGRKDGKSKRDEDETTQTSSRPASIAKKTDTISRPIRFSDSAPPPQRRKVQVEASGNIYDKMPPKLQSVSGPSPFQPIRRTVLPRVPIPRVPQGDINNGRQNGAPVSPEELFPQSYGLVPVAAPTRARNQKSVAGTSRREIPPSLIPVPVTATSPQASAPRSFAQATAYLVRAQSKPSRATANGNATGEIDSVRPVTKYHPESGNHPSGPSPPRDGVPIDSLRLSPQLRAALVQAGIVKFTIPQDRGLTAWRSGSNITVTMVRGTDRQTLIASLAAEVGRTATPGHPRVLVLTQRRDAATQLSTITKQLLAVALPGRGAAETVALLKGGAGSSTQKDALRNARVIVGTTLRVASLVEGKCSRVQLVVLDDAFEITTASTKGLAKALSFVPPGWQTLAFSQSYPVDARVKLDSLIGETRHIDLHAEEGE